jgi:hypothetical protein
MTPHLCAGCRHHGSPICGRPRNVIVWCSKYRPEGQR